MGRTRPIWTPTPLKRPAQPPFNRLRNSPVLPHEAVDGDGDEEHERDLADEPRIGVHPVARLGQEGLPPFAEYEQEERRQCQEQQREQQEREELPPRIAVT